MGSLRRVLTTKTVLQSQVRNSGYSVALRPSRWTYDKFKDDLHFYFMLGAIPSGLVIALSYMMVGSGELQPIPEGYNPKEWEYYKSPITRFLVKHFKKSLQELYEVSVFTTWENHKVTEMRQLRKEVRRQMALHGDYKAWYHREDMAHYVRVHRGNIQRQESAKSPVMMMTQVNDEVD